MSSLEIDGYSQSGVGCDKSNILEERVHPLFESYVLPETKQKIDTLISKLDYSSRLKLHGIFIRMKSDLVSSAMRFVKEIQTVFEVSCRDDISAILSCLILRQRRSKLFWTRIPHTSANVERGLMELRKLAIGLESLCKIWDSSNNLLPVLTSPEVLRSYEGNVYNKAMAKHILFLIDRQIQISMALRAIYMLVAIMAILSAAMAQDEFGMAPAPSPDHGAGYSLPISAAVVGSSLVLSLLALIKN
ncbi:Leucine-rich PPR motif-containing protein [Forsythia ovata]|uniref:Leucine-rich PPR motif-containing protein n=1 Tax=Forsythia ovata TaxID=205694 RepID=A0ABD1TNH5_9LAMI